MEEQLKFHARSQPVREIVGLFQTGQAQTGSLFPEKGRLEGEAAHISNEVNIPKPQAPPPAHFEAGIPQRLNRLRKKAGLEGEIEAHIPQGLNSLRKNSYHSPDPTPNPPAGHQSTKTAP